MEKERGEAKPVTATAKVTSKGQVTIPKLIRDAMEIESGDELLFVNRDGIVYVERLPASLEPGSSFGILHRDDQEYVSLDEARRQYRSERSRRQSPSDGE